MPKTSVRCYSPSLRSILVAAAGLSLLLGTLTACSEPDGGGSDGGMVEDTGLDISYGEGSWEECCKEGEVSTCYCPGGVDCGYGEFTQCGGGRCASPPMTCSGDAGDVGEVGDGTDAGDAGDTGPTDTGGDTGSADTGPLDTGPDDTGTPDTSPADTGPVDTAGADTSPADVTESDATDIVEADTQ